VKKRPGGLRDKRQEPDEAEAPPVANLRVDRVFAAAPRPRPRRTGSPPAVTAAAARPVANRRPGGDAAADAEIALRHQLLQLQRQLAEAQRALATRDAELAREVEKRTAMSAASDALHDQLRVLQARVEELTAEQTRTAEVETRLREIATTAEELSHEVDFERELRSVAHARIAELRAELERGTATAPQDREVQPRTVTARRRARPSKMEIKAPSDPSDVPDR